MIFQLTRSRGAWQRVLIRSMTSFCISTHTLTWSVTSDFGFPVTIKWFQLTRSRGAWRHKCIYPYWQIFKFQLTRSRGAWHARSGSISIKTAISTHTLTWSVTIDKVGRMIFVDNFNSHAHVERDLSYYHLLCVIGIFQLTRSRGAWHKLDSPKSLYTHFNSHAHVERDTPSIVVEEALKISTHTLTWSVTSSVVTLQPSTIFQLTRSRGAWPFFLFCL